MGRVSVLLLVLSLTASACTGDDAQAEPSTLALPSTIPRQTTTTSISVPTTTVPAPTTSQPAIVWDFSPSEAQPIVTLIDPGNEPHAVRAYALTRGAAAETTMRFGFSVVQVIDGEPSIDVSTDVDFEFVVEVADVTPEGVVVTTTFGDFRARASDPNTEAALNSVYAGFPGTSTTQLIAPSGQILAVARDQDLDEFADLTSAIASAAVPLPPDPIGIGAEWEVVGQVDIQGIVVVQTVTVTLVAIEGSLLHVEMEVEQEVGPEGLTLPGLDLTDAETTLSATGSGSAVWDLTLPVPVSGTTEAVQTMNLSATFAGAESTLDQTTTIRVELPSPAAFGPPEGTEFFNVAERDHREGTISYQRDPPAGGPHASVWQNCGFYDEPVPKENVVHSQEHGAVWITYRPDLPSDQVSALRELAAVPFTLVSPYPDLEEAVVASAWGVQLRLDSAFDPRLAQFVDWFARGPQTPEPGAPCDGGTGDPLG